MEKPKIHSAEFVLSSDFFDPFPQEKQNLCESDNLSFSWGGNNRTLITVEAIVNEMACLDLECSEEFLRYCNDVGQQTYVDLEN